MKTFKKITFALLFTFLFMSLPSVAQDRITPPTKGKSVIYLLRTTGLGSLMNFRFFEEDTYLGKFNGKNYLRYECEPGEHLFWVKAENIDVLKTNLAADRIYFVEVNAVMGGFSAGVKYRIVDYTNEKQMKRIRKLLVKKDPKVFTKEQLSENKEKMDEVIKNGMQKVQEKMNGEKKIKEITPDMNYKM